MQLCMLRQGQSEPSPTNAHPQSALQYPGTFVRHSLQTSPIARAYRSPYRPAETMLRSPLRALAFLAFFSGRCIVHCFPGIFLLWITLSEEAGSCRSPPPSCTVLQPTPSPRCSRQPAVTALAVSKARRHLWLFPKSVMMEGGKEV